MAFNREDMQLLIMNLKRPIYVTIDWDIRKEFSTDYESEC